MINIPEQFKIKNLIIYSFISSIFLFSLVSIWKILATLQGIQLENFNTQIIFILGFLFSFFQKILFSLFSFEFGGNNQTTFLF